jgi:hypothetical protein
VWNFLFNASVCTVSAHWTSLHHNQLLVELHNYKFKNQCEFCCVPGEFGRYRVTGYKLGFRDCSQLERVKTSSRVQQPLSFSMGWQQHFSCGGGGGGGGGAGACRWPLVSIQYVVWSHSSTVSSTPLWCDASVAHRDSLTYMNFVMTAVNKLATTKLLELQGTFK